MRRKRAVSIIIISVLTTLLFCTVFEISYRNQWFDFYKAELKGLNSKEILRSTKKKILICGDSFTATPDSYVQFLRDSLPEYSIINAAVPGTCIIQHSLYMPNRIKKFDPDIFIYQFYIGNDLFDISHPLGSPDISWSRKAYWWLSDRMLSLSFLNFRFAGVRYRFYDDAGGNYKPKENEIFSVDAYSKREKLNYKAEPELVENTLFLKNGRSHDLELFKMKFRRMVKGIKPDAKKYFVIIPHESQLSEVYQEKHRSLGANYTTSISEFPTLTMPLYSEIIALCKELNFEVVDFCDYLKVQKISSPVYFSNDPHLNHKGQYLLGCILFDLIKLNRPG